MSVKLDLSKGISKKQEDELRSRYSNEHVNWLLRQVDALKEEDSGVEASPEDIKGEVFVDSEGKLVGKEDPSDDDYEAMTNEQLREELKSRDLAVTGNKDELVSRLRQDDASAL